MTVNGVVSQPFEGRSGVDKTHSTADRELDQAQGYTSKYPEILWLADEDVRKTEEGIGKEANSHSERLFGKKFVEFDRTLMSLKCLELILDGDETAYSVFTQVQPEEVRLSYEDFMKLKEMGDFLIFHYPSQTKEEVSRLLEAALVLGDLGKTIKAREIFAPYGADAPDHDDFYGQVMLVLKDHPELSPTFDALDSDAQQLLIRTSHLAHYGHISHLEGSTEMFSDLIASDVVQEKDNFALQFDMFVHLCDVAGALGHVNNESSIVMNKDTFTAIMITFDACRLLLSENANEMDALNHCLLMRGKMLGLDPQGDLVDRALIRVGAMMRLFTSKDGVLLKEAVSKLEETDKERVIKYFSPNASKVGRRTPTYLPAVFVNLANNKMLGEKRDERFIQAISIGLPFVARVLETYDQQVENGGIDPQVPLNLNSVAGVVKVAPLSIKNAQFTIDPEGNVSVQSANIEDTKV